MINPGNKTFLSGDNPVLEISQVETKLNAVFSAHGIEVMNETYFPDFNKKVFIRDLGKLAQTYFIEPSILQLDESGGPVAFSIRLADSSGSNTIEVMIYPCDVETAGTLLVNDLQIMPLTRGAEKTTYPGGKEVLGFYGKPKGRTVSAGITYRYDGRLRFASGTVGQVTGNVYQSFDVSPSVMIRIVASSANGHQIAESDICYYTVNEEYPFRFEMNTFVPDSLHRFLFRNCFHTAETFLCTGDRESDKKWDRTTGTVNNSTILINRVLTDTITVYTGYLTESDCGVLEDLLNSKEIYLVTGYGLERVVIMEETFKVTNRKDDVISASFEYRLSSNNHSQFRFRKSEFQYRIFDSSFNATFN